jgi:peptide/nickel transport system substrate-binding protein
MFGKFCTVPAQEIDVCPNAGWTRDFADPQTILDPLFAGYNIVSTGNTNIGQVDVPEINAAMRTAERLVGASVRAQAWAGIDRMLVDDAAGIPWEFIKNPTIESRNVDGVNDLWNAGYWDYSYTSLK